jgi:hypothetical protein
VLNAIAVPAMNNVDFISVLLSSDKSLTHPLLANSANTPPEARY